MTDREKIIALSTNSQLWARDIVGFIETKKIPPNKRELFAKSLKKEISEIIIRYCAKEKIEIITFLDKNFPSILKEIPDFPAILYCRGNTKLLKEKHLVAVVGSRKATGYGLTQTKKVASQIAEAGAVVVSGLALGIDGESHRGALQTDGRTIAVLGTAIDKIYPSSHSGLARQIIKQDGLIISEYPPNYPFFKQNFVLRNRIIAGLSKITAVMEAAEKSGALITAALALEYNREVFALPGNADRFQSKGTNFVLKKGASCLTEAQDILDALNLKQEKKDLKLEPQEKIVYELVGNGKSDFDTIQTEAKISSMDLNQILLNLELKGLIKRDIAGNYLII